ncbi:Histone transcription regulator 3, partial [Physocladia obscura]
MGVGPDFSIEMFCSLNDRPTATPAQQTGESTVASKSKYLSAKSKQKQKPNSKPADSAPANLSLNNALEQGREISREMEVQNCLVEFRRILHLQRKQSINSIAPEESQPIKEGYARLITNRVLQISLPEVQSVQDSPIHALQFVVHKNYSILVEQDHPELAQTLLLKTVKIDPSSSQAWCRLGNVSMKLKDHSLAVAAFQHALQVCQTQIEYWLSLKGLCEATFEIGDFEACIPLIQLAKSINPDYTLADAMRIEIMNESRFELPFDSSAQQTRLRNSVKKAPAKKLVPRITVRLNEAELSWILFADTLIDVYRDGLGGPVLFILDDFRGNKIETVTSGNELAMFADADYNGKEKELMDTEMDTENPKYQEINDKTVETNSPDTPSIESDENNYGQEGGDNKTAKDTITKTSPTKRKKRFRDLEARTSKRIKEETTASNAALLIPTSGKAIALDNDLVSDQDFFETTENIIPETVAFTIKFQPRSRHSGKHTFQNTLVQSFDEFERVIKGFTIRIGGIVGDHTGNTGSDCRDGIIDTTQSGNLDFESNQSMEHSISHQDPFNKNTIKSYIESLNINRLNLTAFEIACGFIKFLFGGIYTATTNPAVLKIDNELLSVQMMATKESVKKWPEGLKSRVVAILLLLERGNCGSCLIFTNAVGGVDGFNNCEFENSVLSICELLFDYIVELKRELVPDTVQIAEVTGLLEAWWSVLKIPLTTGLAIYNDDCFLILRKDWLEGQMCEFFLQFEKAVDLYKTCLEIISAQNFSISENNAKIQANTLRTRIQSLSLEKHLQDSETASNAENHVTVLQNLHCLLFQDNSFSTWFSALLEIKVGPRRQHSVSIRLVLSVAQRIRILKMLLKAYDYLDMMTELFVCRVFLVISQVKYLLESNNFKEAFAEVSDFVVDVSEHCLVIVILKDNNAMLPILDFMGYPNSDAVYLEWTGCVFSLVRMAWEVVKCRDQQNDPAFVNFAIRSWSIMYFLCKSFEHDAKKAGVRLCKSSLEWIEFAHSQLGEVSICGGDNSSLLDLTVRACLKAKDGESMTELYQGFCCKYAITCTVDSSHPLMEHNNKPIEITVEDAAAIFIPLSKFVMKKLAAKENRAITNDLRDTVDTISEKFDEPPWNNGSRSLIDQFLASGIHKKHARPLPTLDYQANMSHFDVYKNLFFVRGRLACLQKRIVIGIKTKKSFENLELAGEEYLFNVYMNPRSPGAWILLAEVYSSLCDEYLSWSAFDIISNLELIRGYQLSAYHCFEQAVCLIRFRKLALLKDTQIEHQSSAEQIMSLWGNFGYLCYAIVIPPMKGIALKSSQLASDSLWSERYLEMTKLVDANVSNLNLELEGRKSIILRGIQCFKTAFKLNPKEWRYPFMVAKMSAKLDDISSKTTVEYFSQAISLVPKNWQTKEQETILDAHYCLASYLCKCLHSRKLE